MKITLLLMIAASILAAETPKTTPPAAPKMAMLTLDQAKDLRIIFLQRELLKRNSEKLDEETNAIFVKACQSIGGAGMIECDVIEPNQANPGYGVRLKPVVPVVAKVEAKK